MVSVRRELSPRESKFSLPSIPTIMEVTPDMASDWLSYRNHPNNRKPSPSVTRRYQSDMERGLWLQSTPEGYSFDTDGWLINGQHRLQAQANAGVTLKMFVFPDQVRESFKVFDTGHKRQAGQLMGVPNGFVIASGLRYIAALSDQDRWGLPRLSRVTPAEIMALSTQWPEVARFTPAVAAVYMSTSIPKPPHVALLAMASRTEHAEKIGDWLEALRTGAGVNEGDPRLTLRNRYRSNYYPATKIPPRLLHWQQIARAWNAFAEGRELPVLMTRANDPLVPLTGFSWGEEKTDDQES